MLKTIYPPWDDDDVDALNTTQRSGIIHPFTCPSRGDGRHVIHDGDLGALIATTDGWVCLSCNYTQDWALGIMLYPEDPFGNPEPLTRPKYPGSL